MILDNEYHCWWCKRTNTRLVYGQAGIGGQVQRVPECADRDDCNIANILRTQKVGAR